MSLSTGRPAGNSPRQGRPGTKPQHPSSSLPLAEAELFGLFSSVSPTAGPTYPPSWPQAPPGSSSIWSRRDKSIGFPQGTGCLGARSWEGGDFQRGSGQGQ